MDITGVARIATDMKTAHLHTEIALRVMKMSMEQAEQGAEGLLKMIDASLTGIGQNIDVMG